MVDTQVLILQFLAWFVAFVELVLGLYILALNFQHPSNRNVSIFLLLLSINAFAIGAMIGSQTAQEAYFPTMLLAGTITAIQPVLLYTSIELLKPEWYRGRLRGLRWIPIVMAVLPLVFTIIDAAFNTQLWFTGLDETTYTGGYVGLNEYTGGSLRSPIVIVNLYIMGMVSLAFLLYAALGLRGIRIDKKVSPVLKRLAWVLFTANLIAALTQPLITLVITPEMATLIPSVVFAAAYTYGAFQQMISERRMQRGSLQVRLTALVIAITLPLIISLSAYLGSRAQKQIEHDALVRLETANHTLTDSTSGWLEYNHKALTNYINSDSAVSMDPNRQKPDLEHMGGTYTDMYLISTTDLAGINVARSDGAENKDYSDRAWYQGARDGAPVTYQTLIGRTSGQPALVVSMPILDSDASIKGVGMFASDLDEVSHLVERAPVGEGEVAFVVDSQNQVIAHPDQTITAELTDFSDYPPVAELRAGKTGLIHFSDQSGQKWIAYVERLENGWGIITQQTEAALLAPVRTFQIFSIVSTVLGMFVIMVLTWFIIRQGTLPIRSLTETATAIIEGDLTRTARVDAEDEFGLLASTFNTMTGQLRSFIVDLESRIAERTNDLEVRAVQLQVAAEVAREAAAIRDQEQLLSTTVNLISERFGFYHSGIFLLSEGSDMASQSGKSQTSGYALLRAASSEGGQNMLARQHKLEIGQRGIVGYAAASGQPRIALDVGQDAVFFDNPDLPDTRSEMALPLKIQERVIGVLDVQSTEPSAFSDEDIAILQVLADQIALSIQNTRLMDESQRAVQELETLYGAQVHQGWQKHLEDQKVAYVWDLAGVRESSDGLSQGDVDSDSSTIQAPIVLRGQRLGNLVLRRGADQGSWSSAEKEIINQTISQVALALENARLYEDTRRRAERERMTGEIISKVRSSNDPQVILQTAVSELRRALQASRAQVMIHTTQPQAEQVLSIHQDGEIEDLNPDGNNQI